ncbi:MAG: hypothetical protein ACOY5C_07805 [Pseudomonadota bacterium]|uniref:hypothetical protein n=1 Tax=Thermithiobacillus tepidarius TaxID=929 RepID=UPI0004009EFB|nr:hypothetical protein [Thermithiobacillus tepidarius]
MSSVDLEKLKELNDRLNQAIQQCSHEELVECAKLLVLELAYYKVRHTIYTSEAFSGLYELPPTQLLKVIAEANNEFTALLSGLQGEPEKLIHIRNKLQSIV